MALLTDGAHENHQPQGADEEADEDVGRPVRAEPQTGSRDSRREHSDDAPSEHPFASDVSPTKPQRHEQTVDDDGLTDMTGRERAERIRPKRQGRRR